LSLIALIFFSTFSFAQTQSFGPVTFQLIPGWVCNKDNQNLVCLDKSPQSKKNSALVLSLKIRSSEDSLPVYRDQLSRPRTLYQGDMASPSIPKGIKDRTINSDLWVEGIHIGSEIPEYYTHYLATVSGEYAVLISVSVLQTEYTEGLKTLEPIISSLKLTTPQTKNDIEGGGPIVNPFTNGQNQNPAQALQQSANRIVVLGYSLPKMYVFLAAGLLVVLGLLGYAILSD